MALRPARIYKEWKRPYTRTAVRVHRRAYIKGVPGSKLRLFNMGNTKGEFEHEIVLVSKERVQLRHNALEAARVAANAYMRKKANPADYHLKVLVYPHHVLREHAQAAVAQADRFYQGMSHPFGKPVGYAARVKENQEIFVLRVNEKHREDAKVALKRAGMKLGSKFAVVEA